MTTPIPFLRDRIDAWSREHASDFPPEVRELFAQKTEEILKSDILSQTIRVGESAPDFVLPTTAGQAVSLGEVISRGPAILNFYRGAWCPYCTIEFRTLLESMPHFREWNATVLAVSPQVMQRHNDPAVTGFFDLCDEGNRVARQFGLVYPLGDEIRRIYQQFGIRLEELHRDDSYEVPLPATYVIDSNAVVRYAHANVEITERAEPRALLDQLTRLAA